MTLDALIEAASARPIERSNQEQVDDAVFQQAFIPRTLDEVTKYERDVDMTAEGKNVEGVYYQTITGMKEDLSGATLMPKALQEQEKRAMIAEARADIARGNQVSSSVPICRQLNPAMSCGA